MNTSFPIYFIWEKATHSPVAATIFMACMFTVSCIALNAVHQTASRLTWSFARDEALFYSNKLASVRPTLGVPVYAILLDGLCVLLLGVVYVASSNGMMTRPSPTPVYILFCALRANIQYNSIQRFHKYYRCRRTNILRHPLRTSPVSSSIGGLPPTIETIQTNQCTWVHSQHCNDCVGCCVDCLFLLSNCIASYRWKYEYALFPSYTFLLFFSMMLIVV